MPGGPLTPTLTHLLERVQEGRRLQAAWKQVAPPPLVTRTTLVGWRGGRLVIEAENSGALYELTSRKRQLLDGLRAAAKGVTVKGLEFRVGGRIGSHATQG